ncbi:UDP-glycosyltransferase 92A1-like [Olea europaea subsp. europaea]|uniref:Glycosyltransferase n=1 Tax=Olea europaea subsp. europaea TaxID=158383 RepID=A0A8S0SJX9_OLEEU|nr:UDP-glycosyltransferase 92A1-like [Olea europaea subsp. europaea]
MERRKENVLLFPFMAKSHIIPFLALAQQIERKGYTITFVNTSINIKKLQKFLPSNSSIRLLEIPFNAAEHGLPPEAENSDSLPYKLVLRILEASSCLEQPFRKLLADLVEGNGGGEKPVCVVADFIFDWTAHVAHEFGVFHAIFSCTGGYGMACYYSMWLNLPHKHTESQEFMLPDFPEAGKFHVTQLSPALLVAQEDDPFTTFQRKNLPNWSKSDGILFNTFEEIDKRGLTYFRRKLGIPVLAVGPILLSEYDRSRIGRKPAISPASCIEWLNKKQPNSVLFISFGSQNTISASQMLQLAKALDSSRTNFIWVVRPPLGHDMDADFVPQDWLPEGFVQHIEDQEMGLIVEKWGPQMEILSHKSTAAFLSNCGWNSVLESLKNGVPLIGWPMAAEQYYNAKVLVEEAGVCVEVARGTCFEVRQEEIMEKIELVMGDNYKSKEIKRKACEIKELIKDATRDEESYKGSSVKAMEELFISASLSKEKTDV